IKNAGHSDPHSITDPHEQSPASKVGMTLVEWQRTGRRFGRTGEKRGLPLVLNPVTYLMILPRVRLHVNRRNARHTCLLCTSSSRMTRVCFVWLHCLLFCVKNA